MSYDLALSRVTPPMPGAVAPARAQAPAPIGSSGNPTRLTKLTEGTLAGSQAGSYAFYSIAYPGDGTEQMISLNFWPAAPNIANTVFGNVYQDGKQLATANGIDFETLGQMTVGFSSTSASPILVQVANYSPDNAISFTIDHH